MMTRKDYIAVVFEIACGRTTCQSELGDFRCQRPNDHVTMGGQAAQHGRDTPTGQITWD